MILTLDLGTTTGWACSAGQDILSGIKAFKMDRFAGGGFRFLLFERWLDQLHALHAFTELYYEKVMAHKGTHAAHVYGGFLAILTKWCELKNLPYQGVPVGVIKKHLTGKGNAGKETMVEHVKALGFAPEDDNEADAIALMRYILDGNLFSS